MRNHEVVRNAMFTNHIITDQEHDAWWQKTQSADDRKLLLMKDSENIVAVIFFYDINREAQSTEWAFYLNNYLDYNKMKMLKIWQILEELAIDYARDELGLKILYAEVFEFNESVINMHEKYSFKEIERYARERDGKSFNVVRMCLKLR